MIWNKHEMQLFFIKMKLTILFKTSSDLCRLPEDGKTQQLLINYNAVAVKVYNGGSGMRRLH